MKKYRLKPEAASFFEPKYSGRILTLKEWEDELKVSIKALDEVQSAYVTYGHEKSKNITSVSGWKNENWEGGGIGGKFYFTINFPSMTSKEYSKFIDTSHPAEMMDRIQREMDKVFEEFLNEAND